MPKRSLSVLFLGETAKEKVVRSEKNAKDIKTQLSIKWLRLSMDLNRVKQLKYVDSELDKRSGSLKLRGIQMKPFLKRWKKAEYKKLWRTMKHKLVHRQYMRNMGLVSDSKMNDRTQKAIDYFTNLEQISHLPVQKLFSEQQVEEFAVKQREILADDKIPKTTIKENETIERTQGKFKIILLLASVSIVIILVVLFFFLKSE